jgi:hypothetical protein
LLKKTYKQTFGRYKPTEIVTNQSPAVAAQAKATRVMATIANEEAHEHGASLLRTRPVVATLPVKATASSAPVAGKPAPPKTAYEIELADMEDQLVRKIQVTEDDYRDLMQQRANNVQAYLLKTEKVTADRLFVTAPKPVSASSKGEDRVNMTLD